MTDLSKVLETNKVKQKKPWWLWIILVILIVGIGGTIVYGKKNGLAWSDVKAIFKNEPVSTSTAEVTKTKSKVVEATATNTIPDGFTTYANSQYGFSFAYPQTWTSTKEESTTETSIGTLGKDLVFKVNFYDPDNKLQIDCANNEDGNWSEKTPTQTECQPVLSKLTAEQKKNLVGPRQAQNIFVRVFKNTANKALSDWLYSTFHQPNSELEKYQIGEQIQLGGLSGYYSNIGCCANTDKGWVISKDGYIYEIGINYFDSSYAETDMPAMFKQIAGTFKLTDIDQTASWKTYENKDYGFSIKYPSDMSYELSNNNKTILFQTSEDRSSYAECLQTQKVECIKNGQLSIAVDQYVGTNGDNISLSLDQIVKNRVDQANLANDPAKTTLGSQPAYEAISIGMFSSYTNIVKFNNHIYDFTIIKNCNNDSQSINTCKVQESAIQKSILSTVRFTK